MEERLSLLLVRAKKCFDPLRSTLFIITLFPNGGVRYPTVEAEKAELRIKPWSTWFPHIGMNAWQVVHDAFNSFPIHNYHR